MTGQRIAGKLAGLIQMATKRRQILVHADGGCQLYLSGTMQLTKVAGQLEKILLILHSSLPLGDQDNIVMET